MDDTLLSYYERELTFVREMGALFAAKYPKIAGRLQLEPDKCHDPHTERLIEAFAYIGARIHKKIDDDFPEITESILGITYPHYNNPIPSMTIVRFAPNEKSITEKGYDIEAGTTLLSRPVNGMPCSFQLCAPVTLWPVKVKAVSLDPAPPSAGNAVRCISITIETINDVAFCDLGCQSLRFFLNGQAQHIFHIYERIFNNTCCIAVEFTGARGKKEQVTLDDGAICPVGFGPDDKMLPFTKRSFPGYRLLFEYFTFPEKFLYFDLKGFGRYKSRMAGSQLCLKIFLDAPVKREVVVNADTFVLYTAPAVNLFQKIAEPMRVAHKKTEYQVVPDLRRANATEVYTVDRVAPATLGKDRVKEYRPFYSIRHHLSFDETQKSHVFWHSRRRASGQKGDKGTRVYLEFTDLNMSPADPDTEILTIHVTCTNRDLPERLPFGEGPSDFTMELAAPVDSISCMVKPTGTLRPFLGKSLQWRLISHLSLNYISIVEGGEDALKEILNLYDFQGSATTRQQISGIVRVSSRHVTKRIGHAFARGVEITITLDEDKFVGSGLYLFACVLERFLGQYVSVNSFVQLVLKTIQQKEELKRWPPRSGNQVLV